MGSAKVEGQQLAVLGLSIRRSYVAAAVAKRYSGRMTKTTPLRVSDALLREAKQKGARTQRSAAAQIEHWARVGRILEPGLTDAQIEGVAAGLAKVTVVEQEATPMPDLEDVLAELHTRRESGDLATKVAGPVRYRAAAGGGIEQVTPSGVRRGHFLEGSFVPDAP